MTQIQRRHFQRQPHVIGSWPGRNPATHPSGGPNETPRDAEQTGLARPCGRGAASQTHKGNARDSPRRGGGTVNQNRNANSTESPRRNDRLQRNQNRNGNSTESPRRGGRGTVGQIRNEIPRGSPRHRDRRTVNQNRNGNSSESPRRSGRGTVEQIRNGTSGDIPKDRMDTSNAQSKPSPKVKKEPGIDQTPNAGEPVRPVPNQRAENPSTERPAGVRHPGPQSHRRGSISQNTSDERRSGGRISALPEPNRSQTLAASGQPNHGPARAGCDKCGNCGNCGKLGSSAADELWRLVMDKSDLFTSEVKGLRQSLQDLTTRLGHAVDKQENMEKQLAEQSRWSQEAKEELERQIAIIETQQNLLLAEEQPSFARSTTSEDEAASEGEEEEVEEDDDFDSGPEYEEPDDRTFRPEGLSENGDSRDGEHDEGSESEEYEQFAEAEQTPCATRAGRKRRAKAQNPSPHPSKKRPAWVRRETAVPNPHLATIARDLERRRSGVRGWMGRGTGIRSDPVVVD
ncbi:hypothetical protein N656DRAFT_85716 [Canariomyces notabilis]|uniref:Uncharacterized protein n=1 Tax=Canariomyces notabilis TaxID=2074819 RepID=A0AAN6YRU2_9PEZI|nr:hypothetical protein N656DRAFT_85716 [Canariomyces arenarius]